MKEKEYFIKFIGKVIMENRSIFNNESNQKDINEIRNVSADELYHLCGISKSMPISFDEITKHYKVKIMGTDFNFISQLDPIKKQLKGEGAILGMVNVDQGMANIYYNNSPQIDIPRQRFTIAHELAHCINHYDLLSKEGRVEFLHDDNEDEYFTSEDVTDDEKTRELICNKFARDFLIPNDLLVKVMKMFKNVSVSSLAELFMVPEKEMKIKLNELGDKHEWKPF